MFKEKLHNWFINEEILAGVFEQVFNPRNGLKIPTDEQILQW
jgi:hypothetical protein